MSRKSKGINAERELIHLLWKAGWACIRVAGSGAIKYPTPDIVAGNSKRIIAVECKCGKGPYQYIEKEGVENLKKFASIFGAEPWIGVRFNNMDWGFFRPEDMDITENNYVVTTKKVGKTFSELTNSKSREDAV